MCEPFRQVILQEVESGLSPQRIWHDLVAEHAVTATCSSVKRLLRRVGRASPLPFRRMESKPGEQAHIDVRRPVTVEPCFSVGGSGPCQRLTWDGGRGVSLRRNQTCEKPSPPVDRAAGWESSVRDSERVRHGPQRHVIEEIEQVIMGAVSSDALRPSRWHEVQREKAPLR